MAKGIGPGVRDQRGVFFICGQIIPDNPSKQRIRDGGYIQYGVTKVTEKKKTAKDSSLGSIYREVVKRWFGYRGYAPLISQRVCPLPPYSRPSTTVQRRRLSHGRV